MVDIQTLCRQNFDYLINHHNSKKETDTIIKKIN
jgi:hypothetical protein